MSHEVPQHLLTGEQVTPEVFDRISEASIRLQDPKELRSAREEIYETYPLGAAALALFTEPSERTRYSSLRACARLDIPAVQEADPERTLSLLKGESWADAFLTFDALDYQVIFFRSNKEGHAELAANNTRRAIITNCGDGKHQHPTQAILDAQTIWKTFGRFDGLTIAHVGDPARSRVSHSVVELLGYYNTHHIFSTPPGMELEPEYLESLERRGISFEVMHDIQEAAAQSQILYMSRHQTERIPKEEGENDDDYAARIARKEEEYLKETQITPQSMLLRIIEEKGVRIMHAFPRKKEIPVELTYHPAGLFIEQMQEGVNTRTATTYLQLVGKLFEKSVETTPVAYAEVA